MKINHKCEECLYNKQKEAAAGIDHLESFLKEVDHHLKTDGKTKTAPQLLIELNEIAKGYGVPQENYDKEKVEFNQLMLDQEEKLSQKISESKDPLLESLMLAAKGNYIDFSALKNVEASALLELLDSKDTKPFEKSYPGFKEDIKKAKSIVYLCDNCGEIVLDKLFAREIQKANPNAKITFIVRGENVLNDVTLEDAAFCGLDQEFNVIDNGNNIGGTVIHLLGKEAKEALDTADVIISKGQANFETTSQEGYDPYYLFLCKCSRFTELFQVPALSPIFAKESEMNLY